MLAVAAVSSFSAYMPSAPFGSSVAHSSAAVACVTVARVVGRDVDAESVAPVTAVASSAVVDAAVVVVQPAAALSPELLCAPGASSMGSS